MDHALPTALPVDAWFTLAVDVQLDNGRTVSVAIDGTQALQSEMLALAPSLPPVHPTFFVGASVTASPGAATTGCSVHVDDVLVDFRLQ
jgi:hypothetical protein